VAKDWTVTLRIDTSAASRGVEHRVMDVWHMGHAWLSVTAPNGVRVDLGYYPRDGGIAGPGELRFGDITHLPTQDAAYSYHVSAAQAASMLEHAKQISANPGHYDGLNHNCLSVARELMVGAGLTMPPIDPPMPGGWSAWKANRSPEPWQIHDPAGYNTTLHATADGRSARDLYERSEDANAGAANVDVNTMLSHAQAQATQETGSTWLGDIDSPDPLHADPNMSAIMSSEHAMSVDPDTLGWGGSSHLNPDLPANPGLSSGVTHQDPGMSTVTPQHDPNLSTGWDHHEAGAPPGFDHAHVPPADPGDHHGHR
jgi:hypothetical protein